MEKKKTGIGAVASGAGKAAAGFFDKARNAVVNAVDQNADGKLGLDDVSALSDSVKAAVKEGSEKWVDKQEQIKREKELKALRPIFSEDVEKPDFSLPKLIRIAEMDNKHAESAVCQNSIGYVFPGREMDIVTVYPDKTDIFDLSFYPDMDSGIYYVDPTDRDFYIALDNYFYYLRVARVSELQKLAQDLGAKHFRVTYKEQRKSISENDARKKANIRASGKQAAGVEAEHREREEAFSKVEIAAEMECIGHEPVQPTLVYFKKDPQIQNLVSLRMSDNAMTHQIYTLELSNSSGIKIRDAVRIDAALNAMKLEGNATVTREAQSESRRFFEYEIDF